MSINTIIQVAIGIIFVWVILAVITSQIQEWVASILAWRASMLEVTITQILGNPTFKDRVYNHPLIKGLYSNQGKRKPGGIPGDKFALILFEEVLNSGVTVTDVKNTFDKLKQNVTAIKAAEGSNELKNFAAALDTLLIGIEEKAEDATHAVTEARLRVESWFNNSMERLSGAYRRRAQIAAIVVGISVAAILNADSAAIINTLWKDPVIRQAVVAQASQVDQTDIQAGGEVINENLLKSLSLPIGWKPENVPTNANGWGVKIVGILLSGMAAAQGAPYWFDLMKKLLNRSQTAEPEKASK